MQKTKLKNLYFSIGYLWIAKRQNSHRITQRGRKIESIWQTLLRNLSSKMNFTLLICWACVSDNYVILLELCFLGIDIIQLFINIRKLFLSPSDCNDENIGLIYWIVLRNVPDTNFDLWKYSCDILLTLFQWEIITTVNFGS